MNRRVVVTGVGLVTPLGIGVAKNWQALCEGKSGIGLITNFDTTAFQTKIAGEVKGFKTADYLPIKEAKRTEKFIAYAIAATKMALEQSGLAIDEDNADRVGTVTGCALGGLEIMEQTIATVAQKGPKRVSPFSIPMFIGNMAPGMISIHFGAKGPNASLATACAAGGHAVGEAFKLIQVGKAEAMITGGTESVITPTCVAGFSAMKALSSRNDDPQKASRPFDRDRDGFVVGEGCGILILESLDEARRRGTEILAEITGFGMSADSYHLTSPAPDGEGAARCIRAALTDAGLSPDQVDYINAHGTSTPLNDLCETRAIKTVFKDQVKKLAISSTKSMTGHLLGGAGGIESVFTILSLFYGIIPPTINYDNPGDGCDLDYVPNIARQEKIKTAMSNSFGFGGTNASLVFQVFDG